jgi:asparagine synthase (glutamine-hydrolysing)
MCGIAGIFAYRDQASPVDPEELLRIREAMRLRGPDGEGLWVSRNGRVGLAHRRLAIIDLTDDGLQPMATPDGALHITFNGEIYNYRELRRLLESKGYIFRTNSDTEVLLHLYREYEHGMLHHLRGMYAFALWDQSREALLLARDPLGIKPLYYADDGATIRVASQVKALIAGGKVDQSPQPAGHVGFLLWGYVPEPHTLYRGVKSLTAGTIMVIERQQTIRKSRTAEPRSVDGRNCCRGLQRPQKRVARQRATSSRIRCPGRRISFGGHRFKRYCLACSGGRTTGLCRDAWLSRVRGNGKR